MRQAAPAPDGAQDLPRRRVGVAAATTPRDTARMTPDDTRAILSISLLAAFADGAKHDRERAEVKRIAEGLSQDAAVALPTLVQDVLMQRVTLDTVLPTLGGDAARHLAYEMAVCVCDADGAQSPAEQAFLARLRAGLGLEAASAQAFSAQAESLASTPLAPAAPTGTPTIDGAALDDVILKAAILNGALELLPESLSTMAIIPLQMRLVYRIGLAHGYTLDSGHVKDFLATAGVGLTSQYLEQAGRKLLGGLLGRMGGGLVGSMVGGLAKQGVSSGMSFASTWALGHLARRYYAGGRVLSAQMLRDGYTDLTAQAQGLYAKHLPQIQSQARGLDAAKVMALVRNT